MTKTCTFPCWGYQLDWILYRNDVAGPQLALVPGSVEADTNPLLETDCSTKQCWDERVLAGTLGDADGVVYCSDHAALVAKFKVTQA